MNGNTRCLPPCSCRKRTRGEAGYYTHRYQASKSISFGWHSMRARLQTKGSMGKTAKLLSCSVGCGPGSNEPLVATPWPANHREQIIPRSVDHIQIMECCNVRSTLKRCAYHCHTCNDPPGLMGAANKDHTMVHIVGAPLCGSRLHAPGLRVGSSLASCYLW